MAGGGPEGPGGLAWPPPEGCQAAPGLREGPAPAGRAANDEEIIIKIVKVMNHTVNLLNIITIHL